MKPFLELGQFIGPALSIAAVALLVIGCAIYVYGRDWIRARFKRNMPPVGPFTLEDVDGPAWHPESSDGDSTAGGA